ncbi:MAG: ribulose-bisphosphate carboxylase large subunit family protein [Anaerolineae bacterium]|nr:ribulose-bisphosphate carboxylase large subunit family protein [Anaerolineae bacterium]
MDRIYATYLIETAYPLEQAAEIMAGEQSAGTFVRVPGETDELRQQHGAHVERITELGAVSAPSLPGSRLPKGVDNLVYRRAEVVLSFPLANVGLSLPQLMTTVAGNLFELAPFSGLRLLDVVVPQVFATANPGPQFGIEGTRRLSGVEGRPLIGTIIKPSVGLTPAQTASLVKTLCEAGLDFIKDDELIADPPYSPLSERVAAVMSVINNHAEKTGKKVMYAFNISGDIDAMLRNHDAVLNAGGTCVMVNTISVGLAGLLYLRKYSQLPIHGHRNGWGALTRSPALGFDYRAYQKFLRLAGCDQIHVNGLRNKFCETDESVIASARECLEPTPDGKTAIPVFSSGQWAGQAPDTYHALGSVDLIYLAGGGIMAHPGGPAAGVTSLRQGWEAAIQDVPLDVYAQDHLALRQAIEKYGAL